MSNFSWLGICATLGVVGIFVLIALDKPVDQAVVALVSGLVAALVHQNGASKGAEAALSQPDEAPVPAAITVDLANIERRLQQHEQRLAAIGQRSSPAPAPVVQTGPATQTAPAPAGAPVQGQ